jgi:hypothetical protein
MKVVLLWRLADTSLAISKLSIAFEGVLPDPISPWWIHAVVGQKALFEFDYDYIRAQDPYSAQCLKLCVTIYAS